MVAQASFDRFSFSQAKRLRGCTNSAPSPIVTSSRRRRRSRIVARDFALTNQYRRLITRRRWYAAIANALRRPRGQASLRSAPNTFAGQSLAKLNHTHQHADAIKTRTTKFGKTNPTFRLIGHQNALVSNSSTKMEAARGDSASATVSISPNSLKGYLGGSPLCRRDHSSCHITAAVAVRRLVR